MSIETLGQACFSGWKITARCAWGHREGLKSIRRCMASIRLDLESLVWTRGAEFPLDASGAAEVPEMQITSRSAAV